MDTNLFEFFKQYCCTQDEQLLILDYLLSLRIQSLVKERDELKKNILNPSSLKALRTKQNPES